VHHTNDDTKWQQSEEAAAAGRSLSEGRIIDLTKGAARHGFDRARKKAGLETLRFHDLCSLTLYLTSLLI